MRGWVWALGVGPPRLGGPPVGAPPRAMAGKTIPVVQDRGPARFGEWPGYITGHPSSWLRNPDEAARRAGYKAFVEDLERIRALTAA